MSAPRAGPSSIPLSHVSLSPEQVETIRSSRAAYERRRLPVTLLLADLRQAGGIQPPDPDRIHDGLRGILAEAVVRVGGVLGPDGRGLALFGAPIPNEGHAQLACHAALQASRQLCAWSDEERRTRGLNLSPRMALVPATLETGRLAAGPSMEVSIAEDALELGVRVLQVVEHGKVYLTESTKLGVEGRFELQDLGPFALSGGGPTRLYELRGRSSLRSRVNGVRAAQPARVIERRLVSVLNADVVGYSGLMAADEPGTLETLTTYRAVMRRLVESRRGRVVDFTGDNLLAEFASAADAVRCATEIQAALAIENEALPAARRMHFRIGIHQAEVMVEDERLYGDGVNIVARLERLADPGGVCLSGRVFEAVHGELELDCEPLGEQRLRNIPEPVRAYRMRPAATL